MARHRFEKRLRYLVDKDLAARVLSEVSVGVKLPFERVPGSPVWAARNHPDLSLRAAHVFKALCVQLEEGSVEAFDVSGGKRPKGLLSLRWVEKSDPNVVRLTLNGRPLNIFFPKKECTIELETHRELRSQ